MPRRQPRYWTRNAAPPRNYSPSSAALAAYAQHQRACKRNDVPPEPQARWCWEFERYCEHESERGVRPRYEPHRESSLAAAIRMMAHEDPRMNWSGRPKKILGKRGPKPKT